MAEAKARGKVRMEGKDYVMADGDVVEFPLQRVRVERRRQFDQASVHHSAHDQDWLEQQADEASDV